MTFLAKSLGLMDLNKLKEESSRLIQQESQEMRALN